MIPFESSAEQGTNKEIELFNLQGKRMWLAEMTEGESTLGIMDQIKLRLANGVYLYVLSVQDKDGILVRDEVRKWVVSR